MMMMIMRESFAYAVEIATKFCMCVFAHAPSTIITACVRRSVLEWSCKRINIYIFRCIQLRGFVRCVELATNWQIARFYAKGSLIAGTIAFRCLAAHNVCDRARAMNNAEDFFARFVKCFLIIITRQVIINLCAIVFWWTHSLWNRKPFNSRFFSTKYMN